MRTSNISYIIKKTLIFLFFFAINLSAQNSIKSSISSILSSVHPGVHSSVLVLDPLSNDTIYAKNISRLMMPASVTKLFTTITALSLMGPEYKLNTVIYAENQVSQGILHGNIYLKGYGNSLFTGEDLADMVNELKQKGITKIAGDVVADDSYFDDEYRRSDWIEDEQGDAGMPPVSAIVIDRNMFSTTVKGRRGTYRTRSAKVANPPLSAANKFCNELKKSGITVTGKAVSGTTPKTAVELTKRGVALKELIKTINKRSDNFLAECLYKTLGAFHSKIEGSSFYSSQAEKSFLSKNDIITDGGEIVDGSGLSHSNQISARGLVNLLEWAYSNLPCFDDLAKSLSVAGEDGTLRNRMLDSDASAHFFGKTGTLNGVSTLAGYLKCKSGDELIIVIMFEFGGASPKHYRRLQDLIIEAASGYKYNPER